MAARVRSKQADQKAYHDVHSRARQFSVGQSVMVRNFRDGPHWVPGIIVKILRPLSYDIRVRGGQTWKRHLDHIRDGPSVQSSDPEIEANGPSQEDVYFPLPSSRTEAESQVTANQSTARDSPSQSGNDSNASPPGGPSETVRRYPCRDRQPPNHWTY